MTKKNEQRRQQLLKKLISLGSKVTLTKSKKDLKQAVLSMN